MFYATTALLWRMRLGFSRSFLLVLMYLKRVCAFFTTIYWREAHWKIKSEHNIKSATTCNSGLLSVKNHLYAIYRFLDGSNISQIEFESEISGFSEFCRLFKFGVGNKT